MKRYIALFLAVLLCLSFTACSDKKSSDKESKENIEKINQAVNNENFADITSDFSIGETVSNEKCEFNVEYFEFRKKLIPPEHSSFYTYYEAGSGKTYLDFCVSYKSLETSSVDLDDAMSGTLSFNGEYEYTGFLTKEEDNRSSLTSFADIAPLTTNYIHYLFEVPDEVEASDGSVVLKITIGGENYTFVVRQNNSKVSIKSNAQSNKKSGSVSVGEVIGTKNTEFYIDYVNITADVKPVNPADFYSHYEADSGNTYVDFCISYRNISKDTVDSAEAVSAELKYAGKYEYTGFTTIEEADRSDFTYSDIIPLATEYVHCLFEVPQEVADSGESVIITFTIDGNTYSYQVK